MKLPNQTYNRALGTAGDAVRRYRPRRNVNSVVNRLIGGERKAFPPSAIIVQQKKYPDVSFYQGEIDYEVMDAKTDTIILRAGQNLWVDSAFHRNYIEAKKRGMLRGIYYFYDDRVSPGAQAEKLIEIIGDDLPELEIFADWENTYGGQFGGIRNVVAFMEAIERAYPTVEVGLYTGFYWFIEHTNAVLNWAQYQYLKNKPLWLGYYADAAAVRIPAPWTKLTHWQYGTPALDYGQASAEIDMNFYNGTIPEFYEQYKQPEPLPEPDEEQEEPMTEQYYKLSTTAANIRTGPGTNYQDIGDLRRDDVVQVVERLGSWSRFTVAQHSNGTPVLVNATIPVNLYPGQCWSTNAYFVQVTGLPNPQPVPAPEPTPVPPAEGSVTVKVDAEITATIDGRVYVGTVSVDGVELVER